MKNYSKFLLICLLFTWTASTTLAQDQASVDKKPISLEDIWLYYKFLPASPETFNWMKNDNYYAVMEENKIMMYTIKDRKPVETILDMADVEEGFEVESYAFSSEENMLMLKQNIESIYRRSSKETTHIWDRTAKQLHTLHEGKPVMYATFSNSETMVAYVFENNLYYYDISTGKTTQITTDGKTNEIINGGTDWVYEEEFAFTRAFRWSPDDNNIAYYRFDESGVREFSMLMYGELYPDPYVFKYPKAGEDNAMVSLHFYNLGNLKVTNADIGMETDQYIPRIKWTGDAEKLAVLRMNRLQNQVDLLVIDSKTGASELVLTEKSETYITEVDDKTWIFLEDGNTFLWVSERSGYKHVYLYNINGDLIGQITEGDWEVTEIVSVDDEENLLYFMSTEVSPLERHLYRVKLDGKKKTRLSQEKGWHDVSFSSNNSFYLDSYSTMDTPPVSALYNAKKGKQILMLEDNEAMKTTMSEYAFTKPEFFNFATSENVELNGWMIKPPNFDNTKEYPVLMFVYGGPGSQTVKNSFPYFNYIWHQMLAGMGYIVVSVDNRGTGGQGEEFKKCTYADLGHLETIDQIEAAKYLAEMDYIDGSRIGIWGWSYGGYMSSLCLTKGADVFKLGIAVAPVTNWRYYDTIYTERYLKTPQLNAKGYDDNSPINFADKMKGAYLLVHGTADDNVHYQNSMEWVSALVNANVQFDMAFYPNKNHGIFGGVTRYHLYKKMTDFITEKL